MSDGLAAIFDLADLPEKPWQRVAATLFATGSPVHEISVQVEQPVEAVSEYLSSPRGATRIKVVLAENADRLDGLLDAAAVDSLLTLIKIRDSGSASDAARIAACRALLDKTLPGIRAKEAKRPGQQVGSGGIEDEIARLKKQHTGSI